MRTTLNGMIEYMDRVLGDYRNFTLNCRETCFFFVYTIITKNTFLTYWK